MCSHSVSVETDLLYTQDDQFDKYTHTLSRCFYVLELI